jgi:hypothetical protein
MYNTLKSSFNVPKFKGFPSRFIINNPMSGNCCPPYPDLVSRYKDSLNRNIILAKTASLTLQIQSSGLLLAAKIHHPV